MPRPALTIPRFRLEQRRGYWHIVYTWKGVTTRKTTGVPDFERKPADALREFSATWLTSPPSTDPLPAQPTVAELITAYVRDYVPTTRSPETNRDALRPIKDILGHLKPDDLSEDVMLRYAAERGTVDRWGRAGAGKLSAGTIAREVNGLRGVLGWAVRKRFIRDKITLSTPVELPAGRLRYLSPNEAGRLLREAYNMRIKPSASAPPAPPPKETRLGPVTLPSDATGVHLALFIRLSIATAARKSAILGLRWDDVDLTGASVRQVGLDDDGEPVMTMDGVIRLDFGADQGNKRRPRAMVANNPGLYHDLVVARGRAKSDHVIEFRGKPVDDIKKAFHTARVAADLGDDVTPHILKHTAVSWLAAAGLTFSEIAMQTSTSEAVLIKVYGHLSPIIANKVGAALSI